jgi:hypothetical protein
VQAANAIMAMAPRMVTNYRISHFLYEATAMMLAQLLEKHGLGARVETAEVIESSNIFRLETSGIVMVCLSTAKSDAVAISLGDALTKKARSCAMGRFAEPIPVSPAHVHASQGLVRDKECLWSRALSAAAAFLR